MNFVIHLCTVSMIYRLHIRTASPTKQHQMEKSLDDKPISVLMVCLGNICRSPLAQGIMEYKLRNYEGDTWTVDSAGTGNWHEGEAPDGRSVNVARKYGLDISKQRARQIRDQDFNEFDFMLAMDDHNLKHLQNKNTLLGGSTQVYKITDLTSYSQQDMVVPDPFYDGKFEEVWQLLFDIMDEVIAKCKTLADKI